MLKLLIVEDEEKTREGLRDCIQWQDYGVQFAGEARNGLQALDFFRNHPVDIVISDVSMPVMDGIEMVEKMRDINRSVKIIFISGHADLPYLKSAFKLDIIDYIIKPIDLGELEAVIRKVTGICLEERSQNQLIQELKEKLAESMPVLRDRFLSRLLKDEMRDEDIEQRLRFLGLPIALNDHFVVMSMEFGIKPSENASSQQENQELFILTINRAIQDFFEGECTALFLSLNENGQVVILSRKDPSTYDEIMHLVERMHDTIVGIAGRPITVGIGREVNHLGDMAVSYRQSMSALEQRFFLGEGQIIHIDDIEKTKFKEVFYPSTTLDKIIDSLRVGNAEDIAWKIEELFKDISSNSRLSLGYVQNLSLELLIMANKYLLELKATDMKNAGNTFLWQELFQLRTLRQTKEWIRDILLEMADSVKTLQNNTSNNLVELMKKYIRERYFENVTTQKLAEEFFITPNYVCLLFKKETGQTFNDYLTRVRMDKAKEYLKDPTLKMYEIAEKVGFQDVSYFSKLFKSHVGLSPSEFRDKITIS